MNITDYQSQPRGRSLALH